MSLGRVMKSESSRAAQRTAAFQRVQVKSLNSDGTWRVAYRGGEIDINAGGPYPGDDQKITALRGPDGSLRAFGDTGYG